MRVDRKQSEGKDRNDKEYHYFSEQQMKILKHVLSGLVIVLLVAAFAFIVKKGVDIGKLYIDDAMANVQMQNIEHQHRTTEQLITMKMDIDASIDKTMGELNVLKNQVTSLNSNIEIFSVDVASLESSTLNIDTSVNNSILVLSNIGNQILELEKQLDGFKKDLNLLLEGPR